MRIKKLTPRQCKLPYPSITFLSKDKKPARKYGFFILKFQKESFDSVWLYTRPAVKTRKRRRDYEEKRKSYIVRFKRRKKR